MSHHDVNSRPIWNWVLCDVDGVLGRWWCRVREVEPVLVGVILESPIIEIGLVR